nr:DUF2690 domain-containing protein [Phytohabitans rumicis]
MTHYSRTTMAQAVSGRAFPTLDVTLALVRACGGDATEWERRWRQTRSALGRDDEAIRVASPWPPEPVVDGADPESAGCSATAHTAHARKIALAARRLIIGQVELRYSAPHRAVWARFAGYSGLDHIATYNHDVEVIVRVTRQSDAAEQVYHVAYAFDYHWSSLLICSGQIFTASVDVLFDDGLAATGSTTPVRLPLSI